MDSLVWAMSEMTPSVMMRSTKYWEPSFTDAAYLLRVLRVPVLHQGGERKPSLTCTGHFRGTEEKRMELTRLEDDPGPGPSSPYQGELVGHPSVGRQLGSEAESRKHLVAVVVLDDFSHGLQGHGVGVQLMLLIEQCPNEERKRRGQERRGQERRGEERREGDRRGEDRRGEKGRGEKRTGEERTGGEEGRESRGGKEEERRER
ncbi:hypothetical protein EYF80_034604 [Liparis tanakae]|uniref:Uncharacterized protein n=1 Tax=Liparis tanakae TaxID=230148 RepID=A0A4Z2GP79_9TELE|nr:hypothetical protein EYF80_034604 [Liparis tanakae]